MIRIYLLRTHGERDITVALEADCHAGFLSEAEPEGHFSLIQQTALVPYSGFATLLSAYLDASGRESGVFCVSGVAYGRDRAKKADRAWRHLWGETICHMTDLNSRPKGSAFEDWSSLKAGDQLVKSVEIVNAHVSFSVSVSCDLGEVKALAPEMAAPESMVYLDCFRTAYAVCCHLVMQSLGNLVRERGRRPQIAYFFESGDRYQAESQRFVAQATADPLFGEVYGCRSHTVASKTDVRLLETADIMAWEWAKQRDRVLAGAHIRPSLKALLDPDGLGKWSDRDFASASRRALHVTGESLERFYHKIKHLVLS